MKILSFLFYAGGSILVSILLIFIKDVRFLLKFKFSLSSILFLGFTLIIFILLEFLITNKENDKKNIKQIEIVFGKHPNILYLFFICLLASYFEELFFRGYLYLFLKNLFSIFINNNFAINIIIIVFISFVFGILHISQGIAGFIFSFIASITFFISIIISSTIIYAIIAHFVFNFIELTVIIPYKRKKIYGSFFEI